MMEAVYKIKCPKCKEVELEFSFAGNNGYVAMCKVCKELMYYCSIFESITVFKATGESIKLKGKEFYNWKTK